MKNTQLNLIKEIVPIISAYISLVKENIIVVPNKELLFSLNCLKMHINYQFKMLSCISSVDFLNCKYRFSVIYDILSLSNNTRLRIKIFLNEISLISSIVPIYINSNWWEREIWDMHGIIFTGNLDLRRILTDYGFEGHPMRKDFPLSGFTELRYDLVKKRIVMDSLELAQEFRSFSYPTPWNTKNG